LLAAELVGRWAVPDPMALYAGGSGPEHPMIVYDPVLHWRLLPDIDVCIAQPGGSCWDVRTNALGLRDEPFPPPEPAPRLSVLCLGDSSTWGDHVPQHSTYAQVLERELAEAAPAGAGVSVLNAGVPGYSTIQASIQAERLLERFSFDLVTISCLPSDVFPAARTDREFVPTGPGVAARWLAARSHLVSILRLALSRQLRERKVGGGFGVYSAEMVNRVPARPDFEQQLTEIVQLVRSHGAEPLLLTPLPFCVDGPCPGQFTRMDVDGAKQYTQRSVADAPAYRQVTADVARASAVRHVDLATVRDAHPAYGQLYCDEVHPSAEGHALIAAALLPVALELL
jgi:lysophospholipase L1-like esterase